MKTIPLKPYKRHQGVGKQYSYKGVALTRKEEALFAKVNELVRMMNFILGTDE